MTYLDDDGWSDATELAERTRVEERDRSMAETLHTYHGRATLWDLLQQVGFGVDPFCGEQVHSTHYQLGLRAAAQAIHDWALKVNPESISLMRREARDRESRYASMIQQGEEN